MIRDIKYVVVHHTATHPKMPFEQLRKIYADKGIVPFHGVIDFYGNYHRLVGMNTTLDVDCNENEHCFHVAYMGDGRITRLTYDTLAYIEQLENAIQQEVDYPTLLSAINPMQQRCLSEKFAELKETFPYVGLRGYNTMGGEKNNPGFDVRTWRREFKVKSYDEGYVHSLFTDLAVEDARNAAGPDESLPEEQEVYHL